MSQFVTSLFDKYPVLATVLTGLLAAHTLALFIVNLTPTPKDDAVVAKAYKVLEWLAGFVTTKSKD